MKKIVSFILVIIGIVFMRYLFLTPNTRVSSNNTIHQTSYVDTVNILNQIAEEVNKQCPMQIDSVTTFFNSEALQGKVFQYNYRTTIDITKYDKKILKENLNTYLLNNLKTNPNAKIYKQYNVTVIYNYSTPDGTFLFELKYIPDDYKY